MFKSFRKACYIPMLLLALVSCVGLTSCGGDDDDDEPQASESVVGAWRHDYPGGYHMLTFDKNGSYTLSNVNFLNQNWSEYGIYSIKGNVMTRILSDGDMEVYTILTHTAKKLILRYEGEYLGEFSDYDDDDIEEYTRVE